MKRLRVLVLFEVHEPVASDREYERRMDDEDDWFTEGWVLETLRKNGHDVHLGPVHRHAREIVEAVDRVKPDIVWNFVQTFHGSRHFESHVAGILELLQVPFTGSNHRALLLCQDKALSKEILEHHGVPVPAFALSRKARPLRSLPRAVLPALVKPLAEEGSVGISKDSFAGTERKAIERAAFLHESLGQDAIIERYIGGREIYVGVVGDTRPTVLPPRELRFKKVPRGKPRYASFHAKWNHKYRVRWGIQNVFAKISPGTLRKIEALARRTFRVLQMSGYARIDMRLTPEGNLYVVEANPNPEIARYEDVAESAAKAGIRYPELIERILKVGLRPKGP